MAEDLNKIIKTAILEWAEKVVITDLGKELVIKGRATDYKKSRLIADAEIKLNAEILEVWMPDYWRYVEYGVSPNAIPYDPHKRSGKKHSKYK